VYLGWCGWGLDEKGANYLLYGPVWDAVIKYLRTQEERLSLSKNSLLDSKEQKSLLGNPQGIEDQHDCELINTLIHKELVVRITLIVYRKS
jgi:hypothetical protein